MFQNQYKANNDINYYAFILFISYYFILFADVKLSFTAVNFIQYIFIIKNGARINLRTQYHTIRLLNETNLINKIMTAKC